MTHSHDTATPAMSAETVPSEEAMGRVAAICRGYELMHRALCNIAGTSGATLTWYTAQAFETSKRITALPDVKAGDNAAEPGDCLAYTSKVMATLSASHLAKEGGEAGAVKVYGPYGWLVKPIGLAEDEWSLESDPDGDEEHVVSVALYALEPQELGATTSPLPRPTGSAEIERYIARCEELSQDGEYSWWSRLSSILRDNIRLREDLNRERVDNACQYSYARIIGDRLKEDEREISALRLSEIEVLSSDKEFSEEFESAFAKSCRLDLSVVKSWRHDSPNMKTYQRKDIRGAWLGWQLALASRPRPSPALAKGGDAVRDALEDARDNGLIYWEPNTERGHVSKALMLARIDAALSTPTEGPASQTEGMGGDAATVEKLRKLAEAAAKVAPGPWEADGEETEGGWGKHDEFVILDAQGRRLCGTENADHTFGSISEENDGDGGHYQWNEPARVLMHFIAACDPATILSLLATPSPQPADAVREALLDRDAFEAAHAAHIGVSPKLVRSWRTDEGGCGEGYKAQPSHSAWYGWKLCRAALTDPAPAGEAVEPVAWRWRMAADRVWNYQEDRQRIPDAIHEALYAHPAPEDTARLREDLERVTRERNTFADICLVVSGHLELPHAESGPCDDSRRYDRELTSLEALYRRTEDERVEHMGKRFKAEAEAETFKRERDDARKALETVAEDERDRLYEIAYNYVRSGVDSFDPVREFLRGHAKAMLPVDRAAARSASREGVSDE